MTNEAERIRDIYDGLADCYDSLIRLPEKLLFSGGREWVCSRARGKVLEVAVGTGRNFSYYPEGVHLTGVELSPLMLRAARNRAEGLGVEADLRIGDARRLPFPNESFDTVVFTLALCTIPGEQKALSEARRVLKPSGLLLLLEHVRSTNAAVRLIQRLLEPFTVRFQADHLLRDPLDHLPAVGFEVETLERSKWGIVERVLARKTTPAP